MKKQYWKSKTNILDIIVVAFCIVTVIFIWGSDCNGTDNSELIADSILLIIRNLIQLTRILNMLRRTQNQLTTRTSNITFNDQRVAFDPLGDDLANVHAYQPLGGAGSGYPIEDEDDV